MSSYGAIGGLASGLASGLAMGMKLRTESDRNQRENEEFGLKKRLLTGQVEDAERQRADEEAARVAGQRAIADAMKAGQQPAAAAAPVAAAAPTNGPIPAGASDPAAPGVAVATPLAPDGAAPVAPAMPAAPAASAAPATMPGAPGAAPAVPHADAILQGLDARWQTFLGRGNGTKALESFNQASVLRTQLRDKALDQADRQFAVTKDPSVYIEPYNRYVMDGGKVTGITPRPDGTLAVGYDFGGQIGEKVVKPDELQKMIMTMRDPAAMRKHELAVAQKLAEESAKVHVIPDGGTAVSGAQVLKQGIVENPKDVKAKDQYITVKGPKDEGERVMRITPNGLVDATPGAEGGLARRGPKFTGKENLPVHKEIMDIAEKEFGEWDPVTGKNVLKGPNLQKALARASVATQIFEGAEEGGGQMDHATAYRIAQEGKTLPDAVFKTSDGRYMMQPAVRYNNQVFPMGGSKPTDVTDRVLAAQKKGGAPAAPGLKRDGQGSVYREDATKAPNVDDLRASPDESKPGPEWGARQDGSAKGTGYLGVLKTPGGKVASEYTIGVPINGKEMDIPTLVPTLTRAEVQEVLAAADKGSKGVISPTIQQKAVQFAQQRVAAGKSVFADPTEAPAAKSAPAPRSAPAAPAKPGTAAQIVAKSGVTELARRVEAMYPPTEVRAGRGGSARSTQDSPEVAKLKSMSGQAMLKYADELLGATQTADGGLQRRSN